MDPRYKSPESVALQSSMDDFRDLNAHTTLLVWLLRLGALVAAASVWANWLQLDLLGRQFTVEEAQANDLREKFAVYSWMAIGYVCYAVFGRWIVVAHRNLPALGLRYPDITPGWALGWFFVPFANLWKPYQGMRLLWKSSIDSADGAKQDDPLLLVTWWALWIVAALMAGFTKILGHHSTTVDHLEGATRALMIISAFRIPQYLVASFMVEAIWKAQVAQRRRRLTAPQAELPAFAGPA
jgi:Domain of unknown function (DUF4328)